MLKNNYKKIFLIIFTAILLFPFVKINGEEMVCEFDSFDFKINEGNITIDNKMTGMFLETWLSSLAIDIGSVDTSSPHLENQISGLEGHCPSKIYVCKYEEYVWNSGFAKYFQEGEGTFTYKNQLKLFISDEDAAKDSDLSKVENDEIKMSDEMTDVTQAAAEACSISKLWTNGESYWGDGKIEWNDVANFIPSFVCSAGAGIFDFLKAITYGSEVAYIRYKYCDWQEYKGDAPTYNLACPDVAVLQGKFVEAVEEFKKCPETDGVCKSRKIGLANEREDQVKKYCDVIFENYNYDGSEQQDCLETCFEIGLDMLEVKKNAGIAVSAEGKCDLSGKLLAWLANIFRWIKYILPVIVIVLGIIDFIKATGTDKEDEIKKAQGRFVKRLVAAALVFIIPLILEFVLDKMGFGYDDCGIL